MKIRQFAFLLLMTALISPGMASAAYDMLYGFKIGQTVDSVKSALGEPSKVVPFEDGWVAYAYLLENHNVVFETHPQRPDLIISIQIEGSSNPKGFGLKAIDLSAPAGDIVKQHGAPTEKKQAVDSKTKKSVKGAAISFYGDNLSFEEKSGKVSSIKIIYLGGATASDFPGITPLVAAAKSKDIYEISQYLSPSLSISEEPAFRGQMSAEIMGKTAVHELLYGKSGIASIEPNEAYETVIRVHEGGAAYALKFNNKAFNELVFLQTFQGWVLQEVW